MKKSQVPISGFAFLGLLLFPAGVFAASPSFDYPELMVVPRASERLAQEAKDEPHRTWTTHIPVQISALATLGAGITQFGGIDPNKAGNNASAVAGVAVGGGWLVATGILAVAYAPYHAASERVSAMPAGTPREQLARERMAEEAMDDAALAGTRVKWLSIVSNAAVNIYMASQSLGGTAAPAFDGIAAAMALTPLLFPYHWSEVASDQADDKKKIYGPLATASVFKLQGSQQLAPGLLLGIQF